MLPFHVTVLFEQLPKLETHAQKTNCIAGIIKKTNCETLYFCRLLTLGEENFQVRLDKLEQSLEMMSGGLGFAENLGRDINQEELDFSQLFLYNSSDEFPIGCDKGESEFFSTNKDHLLMLFMYSFCSLCIFVQHLK